MSNSNFAPLPHLPIVSQQALQIISKAKPLLWYCEIQEGAKGHCWLACGTRPAAAAQALVVPGL